MPLTLIHADIVHLKTDAVVCSSDAFLSGSGSIDYMIRQKAGQALQNDLANAGSLNCGEAMLFNGYDSGFKQAIFTCGPRYDENNNQNDLLYNCYQNCLKLALQSECKSIAFPLISSGTFKYPKLLAYQIAVDSIRAFLNTEDMEVFLVLYDDESMRIASSIEKTVSIERVEKESKSERKFAISALGASPRSKNNAIEAMKYCCLADEDYCLDESFQKLLFRLIDESGMSDVEVYKKANLDKRLFSKIRSNEHYHPKKETVLALAIALELSVSKCNELLNRAGYSLSSSILMDVIVSSFIKQKKYDIDEINIVLFEHDQKLLGSL